MATSFSVLVNIGGKVNPSLAAAVNTTKAQVNGLGASLAAIGARLNGSFGPVNKHLADTSKRMAAIQRAGRNTTFSVTAPTGLLAVSAVKAATERARAANELEALGELSPEGRKDAERFADSIASKYGDATGILKTFNELLKAGFHAASAKGSLPAILSGSAVAGDMTGADLGGYVSKIVTQFKLGMGTLDDATKSSRRVIDNLVLGAVRTTANTKDMAEAYKYVGSAAAAAGESIESTNAMIIALAKEGQLGSEAGVALRSAYVRMVKPTKGGLVTLARLGLNYGDYVQPGKRTSAGIVAGLSAGGFDGNERDISAALAANRGSPERQRKAIYDSVVAKLGAKSAVDREAVMRAVDDAFAMSGSKVDLTKLLGDLRSKGATQGDLANIFEGRQSVRMLALLKSDLNALREDIVKEAPGFAEKTWLKTYQGLPKAVLQLDAAWKGFRNTIVGAVTPEIVGVAERLASSVQGLAATNPAVLKVGVGFAAIAAAAGPLMFALGSIGRLGALAFRGVSAGLMLMLTPINLVLGGLVALARGIVVAGGAAVLFGARLRGIITAMAMLRFSTIALAGVSTLGAGLALLGKRILAFPLVALRAVGAALIFNPVGLVIAAIVTALTALGFWIANNWEGIKNFFGGFGEGFMAGLKPAEGSIKTIVDSLSSMVGWVTQLVGPLNQTNEGWREWGGSIGMSAAAGFNAVVSAIQSVIGFLGQAIDKAVSFGNAIRNLGSGATGGGLFTQGIPKPSVEGKRALGGSVGFGKPYLVGERGPEIFVPGQTGRIETNDTLRSLTANGATAVAGASSSTTTTHGPVSFSPTFNISGGNANEVTGQIRGEMRRFLAELESEQRGLLSD